MTDSMKFGPEWLRNMKSDTSLAAGAGGGGNVVIQSAPLAPLKLAEFRYGREEMLALFDPKLQPPESFRKMHSLFIEKIQPPIAFSQISDEENSLWNRGVNSELAMRQSKPVGMPGARGIMGGRGGSVDRGRGRARGSYHYSRGLSYEESDPPNGYNRGMRSFDRTQSQGSWSERNGGDAGEFTATSPRKEFSSRGLSDTNWRRHRGAGEDESGWRAARTEKWGRGGSNSWREGENSWDRTRSWEEGSSNSSHPPPRRPWENDESNLPEWATENPSESGGSFDATGAFHGGTAYSDDEEGIANRGSSRTEEHKQSNGQPRPNPSTKKEPPNITNGPAQPLLDSGPGVNEVVKSSSGVPNSHPNSGSGTAAPLRQSQSASSLVRHTPHPLTSSASLSGVNSLASQASQEKKAQKEDPQTKPSSIAPQPRTQPHQKPTITTHETKKPDEQVAVPVALVAPMTEQMQAGKTSQDEEIQQRLSQLIEEEDSGLTSSNSLSNPAHPHTHLSHTVPHVDALWYYQDPQGNVQGPFQSSEMAEWHHSGYFKGNLLVRRACDERYSPLQDLINLWKGSPFNSDYYAVPPIKVQIPNTEPIIPVVDDPMRLQYQQRLMLQRQTPSLAGLNPESFNHLSLEQQKLLAHQVQMEANPYAGLMAPHHQTNTNVLAMLQQLAHFQQIQQRAAGQVPLSMPATSPVEPPLDPVQQLIMGLQTQARGPAPPPAAPTPQNTPEEQRNIEQFMAAFRQRQATAQPPMPPQPQPVTMESVWGGSTWSAPPGHSSTPQSLWADSAPKGIKTEQEVLEEQLRAEEKKKNEELRKQEELLRMKKQEEEEKERQRRQKEEEERERKRKEDEEREKEREKKRMQEEERKKKEAAAAKKAEQDRLRKEEEKKRKEEEKRRKEEEKRRLEEEKKKAEEEKKKQEEERKRREEMTKRQNEALKRLQEQQQQARVVKPAPTPAPWTQPEPAAASLADIQKTERKQQQQLREQQEMLKAFQEKHQQEQQQQVKASKSGSSLNLKWAENAKSQPTRVKSLAEIQAEEHERMTKQAEKEKAERMAAVKEVPLAATGSIWANQSLSWSNTASVWGNSAVSNAVSGSGAKFFEEVSTKPSKPAKAPAAPQPAKSQAKTKAKKEEASVMKLFEKQLPKTSKTDDFNKWCTKTLNAYANNVDIPTFVDFLLAFESQKEVREYIRMYLGETKEANDFASEFIDRRSRLLSNDRQEMPTTNANSNHFQEVKGKNKKVKKNRMMKVDNRILGFNVTASTDRINVGDRDYVDGV